MIKRLFFSSLIATGLLVSCNNPGQSPKTPTPSKTDSLRHTIDSIAKEAQGTVGVAIMVIETGDTLSYNGDKHLPMQSTYKFPLAMYILHLADSGKLNLNKTIKISDKEMNQDTWSPIADSFKNGTTLTIREIMRYMVSMSDNIACDIMFREAGGTENVNTYIHSLGVQGIAIKATEEEMHRDWPTQYTNWCEPNAMVQLLNIFYQKKALSDSNNAVLWKLMVENKTGDDRIRGLLPKGTVVADKTGTGGTNNGIRSATNDIGIITLPNGNHLAIVVYVSDAKADLTVTKAVIAKIAKAAYDNYAGY